MMQYDGVETAKYQRYIESMKLRTKEFALRVIKLCRALPKDYVSRLIGGQLLRSGTSVGANYRAACRACTAREFRAKIRIVMEEADEALFWIELIAAAEIMTDRQLAALSTEAAELTAIFTSAHAKAIRKSQKRLD